jgi:hypothetical protein
MKMKSHNKATKKTLLSAGITALALSTGSAFATVIEYDLTSGPDLSRDVNGAIFSNPSTLSNDPTGTGVFGTFVQIQNNPIEQGYNTSKRGGFPTNPPGDTNSQTNFDTDNSAPHNRDIQLKDIPTLLYTDGNVYRQFLLDINESNTAEDQFLSLDKLQIYISPTAGNYIPGDNEVALGADNALGTIIYDMDGAGDSRALLDYAVIGSGSGRADLEVLVLNSLFIGYEPTDYIYLYSRFGDKGCVDENGDPWDRNDKSKQCAKNYSADFGSNAGFEEWAALVGDNIDYCILHPEDPQCGGGGPVDTPEPTSLTLMGLGITMLLRNWRRRG